MISEFIDQHDVRWGEFLDKTPHDVYHLPEYLSFSADHEGGEPVAFYAESDDAAFLAPLLLRELPAALEGPPTWCDATTPYGYPTPLLYGSGGAETVRRFFEMFRDSARDAGIVSAFYRLHPLLSLSLDAFEATGTAELIQHGSTVYVDLTSSEEELWNQIRKGHRYDIRKLNRSGFEVVFDDWQWFPEFIRVYRETMQRVSADESYHFPDTYFSRLRHELADRLHLCTVLSSERQIAAAGLFMEAGGIVQYHLSGTEEQFTRQSPTKLMLHAATSWARDRGNRVFHLGGGVGAEEDSLFRFKAGFSPLQKPFFTLRMVTDREKYSLLTNRWSDAAGGREPADEHFPAYRQDPNSQPDPSQTSSDS